MAWSLYTHSNKSHTPSLYLTFDLPPSYLPFSLTPSLLLLLSPSPPSLFLSLTLYLTFCCAQAYKVQRNSIYFNSRSFEVFRFRGIAWYDCNFKPNSFKFQNIVEVRTNQQFLWFSWSVFGEYRVINVVLTSQFLVREYGIPVKLWLQQCNTRTVCNKWRRKMEWVADYFVSMTWTVKYRVRHWQI